MNAQRRAHPAHRPGVEPLEGRALMAALAFGPPITSVPNVASGGVFATGDFNRDGKLDVAALDSRSGVGGFSVLEGRGTGAFRQAGFYKLDQPKLHLLAGDFQGPFSIVAGDFNRDGKADLAVSFRYFLRNTSQFYDYGVEVFLGNGHGTFRKGSELTAPGVYPGELAVGDFNRDGKADLAVANTGDFTKNFFDAGVSVLLGNGDGTFRAPKLYQAGISPVQVVVGTLDPRGDQDLVVVDDPYYAPAGQGISVLLGHGDGTFGKATHPVAGGVITAAVVGDFNHDGKPDLAVAYTTSDGSSEGVEVLLGRGHGAFGPGARIPIAGEIRGLTAGDLDGDGKLDLVATVATLNPKTHAAQAGGFDVLAGNGRGGFGAPRFFRTPVIPAGGVTLADVNGDRKPDVVLLDAGQYDPRTRTNHGKGVVVLLNKTPSRG